MTGWNLPPGCTDADIDRAFGDDDGYPYDDDQDDDPVCDCQEYEIDISGRAECAQCGAAWYPTPEEIARAGEYELNYERYLRREARRDFWRHLIGLPRRFLHRVWPRKATDIDDDIPF